MTFRLRHLPLLALMMWFSGCAVSDFSGTVILRTPPLVPDHFMVGSPQSDQLIEPSAGAGCRSPMVDPRDGTRLTLVRSGSGQGDYTVPDGRYGVGADELLRLDCATGRAVGVVRR